MDDATLKRIVELARESLEDWTRRFCRERGLPEPTQDEMAKLMALSKADETSVHQ